jgi:hypothetical protein
MHSGALAEIQPIPTIDRQPVGTASPASSPARSSTNTSRSLRGETADHAEWRTPVYLKNE